MSIGCGAPYTVGCMLIQLKLDIPLQPLFNYDRFVGFLRIQILNPVHWRHVGYAVKAPVRILNKFSTVPASKFLP